MKQEYPKMLFLDGVVTAANVTVNSEDEHLAQSEKGFAEPEEADRIANAKREAAAEAAKLEEAERAVAAKREADKGKQNQGSAPGKTPEGEGAKASDTGDKAK